MNKSLLLIGLFFPLIHLFAQAPDNDTCNNSFNITVSTTESLQYTAALVDATETEEGSCQTTSNNNIDVWFDFTMPVNGKVRITSISYSDNITVYDSCGGTELACFTNDGFIYNLSSSQNYKLKFSIVSDSGANKNFNIQAFETLQNDTCDDAIAITAGTTDYNEYQLDTRRATKSGNNSCENASYNYLDGWYEFTMPYNGNVRISNIASNETAAVYESCDGEEIACFFNDGFIYELTENTTYKLRIAARDVISGILNFRIQAFETLPNDTCVDALTITAGTTDYNEYQLDTRQATQSGNSSCENTSYNYLDGWYEFTMPYNGNVHITNIASNETAAVYESCGGEEVACFFNDGFIYELTENTTYKLRIAARDVTSGIINFRIQAYGTIPNDTCEDAIAITAGTTDYNEYQLDTRQATQSGNSSCENTSYNYLDGWYEFTMPFNGNVRITNIASNETAAVYESCGGEELACFFNDGFIYELTENTTYKLRIAARDVTSGIINFRIQAYGTIPNDTCEDAIAITAGTTDYNEYQLDTRQATQSVNSSCENTSYNYLDGWYEFMMPFNGNVRITNISSIETASVYESCGGEEIACFSNDGFIYELTEGTNYKLRIAARDANSAIINFRVQAFETLPNDTCEDALTITAGTTDFNLYSLDTRRATQSGNSSCEDTSYNYLDGWYEFTMPYNGNVRITNISLNETAAIYESCGDEEIACFFNDGYFYELTEGTTYKLRIAAQDVISGMINFRIQAFETLENNHCSTALEINIPIENHTTYSSNIRGATESVDGACENANDINHDAWYSFVMPVDGNIQITNLSSLENVSLYNSCDTEAIDCQYDDTTFSNLTGGNTYYLRTAINASLGSFISFNIQAVPSPLPSCTTTVEYINGAWSPSEPDASTNVLIRDDYNTNTEGSFSACSVIIELGNTLTIASEDFINIAYGLTVDGTLNIEHQGSLVQQDATSTTTNNGTINVNVTTPVLDSKDFMVMGSPMTNESSNSVFANAHQVRDHNTSLFIPNEDVATEFPLAENFADDNGDDWAIYSGVLNTAEGYLVFPQPNLQTGGSFDLVFNDGTLNNGDITTPIVFNSDKNSSPNVLANPYPSAILADDFITQNETVDEVYFWEHITAPSGEFPGYNFANFSMEDISMYNLLGGIKAASDLSENDTKPNGVISTSQGFGIKANSAGTVTFSNSMRRLTGNTTLRSTENQSNKLWLTISNADYNYNSNTLIGFTNKATAQLDPGYDSKRLASILSIFSGIENSEVELGIQGREAFNNEIRIPIGFSTQIDESTMYSISLNNIEGLQLLEATIILIDNLSGEEIDLNKTTYEFVSEKGQYPNRFTLVFKDRILGSTSETLNDFTLIPNPGNGVFTVKSQNQTIKHIKVYDQLGRIIAVKNDLDISETSIDISKNASGIYFIVITTNTSALTKRYVKK
ncbi:CHU large protein; uncharacterized [unidentified eubacterium SCB49]|nr:CHU large protein; uncharacterized [unidentified eubacterium SCB49]